MLASGIDGHEAIVKALLKNVKLDVNAQNSRRDTDNKGIDWWP